MKKPQLFQSGIFPRRAVQQDFPLIMIISPWNDNITFSTYKVFISQKMISTGIAKPGKQKTYKIIPEII